ncbi:MAG: hypothetical protein AB8G95_30080, partial [Anaerolineae bacterium]
MLEIARSIHKQVLALSSPAETDPDVSKDVVEQLQEPAEPTEVAEPIEKRLVEIELRDETWYVVRPSDGRAFGLCTRLSKSEIDKQIRVGPPQKSQWELPADQARQLKKKHPDQVDFWDEKKGNITTRHFYLTEEYETAMQDWHKYVALAQDAITQGLGLSVAARAAIDKLEADGYEIVLPQNGKLQAVK